jgi:hypothetical protein
MASAVSFCIEDDRAYKSQYSGPIVKVFSQREENIIEILASSTKVNVF